MKNLIWILVACTIGSAVGVAMSIPRRDNAETRPPDGLSQAELKAETIPASFAVDADLVPYREVEREDFDLGGRRRKSIKVLLRTTHADAHRIWDTLRDVAMKQDVDAVYVYAYWPGDDCDGPYTAGRLEWGKNGGGWATTAITPPEGRFDAGELRPDPKSDAASLAHDGKICDEFNEQFRKPSMERFARIRERLTEAQEKGNQTDLVTEIRAVEMELALEEQKMRHAFVDVMKKLHHSHIRKLFKSESDNFDRDIDAMFSKLSFAKGFRDLDRSVEKAKMPYDLLPD